MNTLIFLFSIVNWFFMLINLWLIWPFKTIFVCLILSSFIKIINVCACQWFITDLWYVVFVTTYLQTMVVLTYFMFSIILFGWYKKIGNLFWWLTIHKYTTICSLCSYAITSYVWKLLILQFLHMLLMLRLVKYKFLLVFGVWIKLT